MRLFLKQTNAMDCYCFVVENITEELREHGRVEDGDIRGCGQVGVC